MLTGKKEPKEIASLLIDYGVKIVGLTLGKDGSYLKDKDKEIFIPPFKARVLDSTGAGDSFAAGFLAGYLKGWELKKIGQLANCVGAMCVKAIGATAGIKTLKECQTKALSLRPLIPESCPGARPGLSGTGLPRIKYGV